ncbi:L,D-transpeptidase [Polymorphobacter fuscus]|uniref:L,D-transpeptidase n=1 Tax=Sandarakinorhabdus fusca TaxID=1439888 RepID=A0A7C9GVD7_9SPHN|nr:L,D-transpeptidase [Polymorphobacter fuscus]MQT17458.1 L,D-transpeptidase [Polymorphobacter fuscus]
MALAFALALATPAAGGASPASPAAAISGPVATLAAWVIATKDSHGRPFAIVDKVAAQVLVFDADGTPRARSAALLGLARGDRSVPGIGDRPLATITPAERTTPAGRFDAELGTNTAGHKILWVHYADAISLHPVVAGTARDRRRERLASPTAADNRISFGCINVPPEFFADSVEPLFRSDGGVVYILPEQLSLAEVFGPGVAGR